jgi:hypothetical protein
MLQQLTRPTFQIFLSDGTTMQVNGDLQSATTAAEFLESGGIVYFPQSPFRRSEADTQLLLTQHQKDASYHKNIAYRPLEDRLTGLKDVNAADLDRLRRIMADFSKQAVELLETVFPPYVGGYKLDFASYRPIEENGRKMRLRARNDLIHVDSFPTRPVYGDRILRVFENINPNQGRVWRTSDSFDVLAQQFRAQRKPPGDLNKPAKPSLPSLMLRALGLKANGGSAYCRKNLWEFPPGSAWIVYTDMVSHSVLSGQYALEQTFIVSQNAMVLREKTPINILRKLYNQLETN